MLIVPGVMYRICQRSRSGYRYLQKFWRRL